MSKALRYTPDERLAKKVNRLAKKIGVEPEFLIECAVRVGLDPAANELAMKMMDEALEPLRQASKKHPGKSLREAAGDD